MSYQGWGCSSWMADWDFVKSIAPEEAKAFEDSCNKESSMDDVAYSVVVEDTIDEKISKALNTLSNRFFELTDGLSLQLGWISYDETDSDIHGAVWFVDGVEDFTPAGKKYSQKLHYERWVEYG